MSLLKTMRGNSAAAQSSKLRRLGAMGNMKLARKGEHAPRKYASGGSVDSGPVDGAPSKPRLDRPGRKMAGKDKGKKGGTNVNVIVMPKGGDGPPPMGGAGAAPPMPPHPMPMPPPGAGPGGPPMPPMHKHGGAVGKYAKGGRVKRTAGGSIASSSPADDDDRPIEQAGVVDSVARGAARLFGRGAKAAPKGGAPLKEAKESKGWFSGQRDLDKARSDYDRADKLGKRTGGAVGKYATGGRIANLGKFAHGGKVRRADGGWTGEGDSGKPMKEKAAAKEKESSDAAGTGIFHGAASAASVPAALGALGKGKMRAAGILSTLANGVAGKMAMDRSIRTQDEARAANKAGDEAEGRKRGGSVKC